MLIPKMSSERLMASAAKLPMSASVFSRLTTQLADAATTLEDVVGTVRLEPVMAARVIRVANSPVYRRGEALVDLDEAIAHIGTRETCHIVGVMMASRLFSADLPHYGITGDALWRTSITSAIAARRLAARAGCHEGECYTIALLRSLGRLLLERIAQEEELPLNSLPARDAETVRLWERQVFGIDAMDATLRVLQLWNLAPTASRILRRVRQRPFAEPAAAVLHLANWIVDRNGETLEIERGVWRFELGALTTAGVDPDAVDETHEQTRAEVEKLRTILGHVSD